MPAPLAVDKEAVRVLVVAVGHAEAARRTGLPEATVRQWAHRGQWLAGIRDKLALSQGAPSPERDRLAATLPESIRPVVVTGVTSPADALVEAMREDSGAIKIHALRRARLVAAHGEQQAEIDPEAAAASSADYLANLKGAALAGSWAVEGGPVLNLAIFSAGGIG